MPSLIRIMTCRQAIVWSNAGILLIGHIGKNFNEILIEIHIFSFEEIHSKISSGKWHVFLSRPPCVKHIILRPNEVSKPWNWASSTGLTAVSKFKPCLPAQWAVGTHRKGSSRMEQVTSRMNWPIRNSTQIRNLIYLIDNTIMWSPSVFFISNRFYRTQNNFGPTYYHIITKFSWVVTMAPAVPALTFCGNL